MGLLLALMQPTGTVAIPTPMTFWAAFWITLPSIIAQLVVLVGALTGFYQVWRSQTNAIRATTTQTAATTQVINAKVDSAALMATSAAQKAEAAHITAQEIIRQAEIIAQQTNGQLSKLLEDKDSLRQALQQVLAIIAAREAKVPGVRDGDLPKTPAMAVMVGSVAIAGAPEPNGAPPSTPPPGGERRRRTGQTG
jgi:hypothetical protein